MPVSLSDHRLIRIFPNKRLWRQPDLTTTYGYDQWGNQTSVTINGSSISNGAAPQSGTERKTKLIYDDTGRFLKHKYLSYITGENEEATGEKVSYKYNGKSADDFEEERLKNITTTDDNGVSSTQHFSSLGLETTTTRTGNLTDKILRKYCEDDCPAGSYSIALSSDGKPLQTTFFDKWGRPRIKRTVGFDGQDIDIEITYDAQGRKKRITEPNSSTFFTEYSYDEIGRVDVVNNPSGSKVIISNNELVTTTTLDSDEDDRTTTEEMNAFGETYRTTDALGTVVSFTYNSFGNMLTATTSLGSEVSDIPNSSTITNFYDDWGHKYRTDDPDKGIWNYTYNVFGELYTQRTARGHTFTFSYDRQGRKVRSYNASEGTLCWIYGEDTAKHNVGKLWKARKFSGQNISLENCGNGNPEVGKVYNYNSLGLRKSVTTTVDNHSYFESQTYDEYLRPSVTTFPESSTGDVVAVRKYYNTFHYLNSIVDYSSGDDGITLKEIISVSDRGQVTNMTLGNGVTVDNSYAPSTGWFESSSVSNGTTLYSVDIDSYYTSGNIEQRTSKYATSASAYTEFAETYVYDELNRLTNRSYSVKEAGTALLPGAFTKDHTYGYDYWGNIKNKTGVGYYKYDDTKAHRLVGVSTEEYMADEGVFDVYDMSYDESGNILYDGNRHFEYSTFDKPTLIYTDDNMASSSMRYGVARELVWKQDCFNDGQGKKTQVTTTYIGAFQKLEKMSQSGALVENKYNIGDIVITYRSNGTSDTNYLHSDHQGSIVAISDDAGNVVTQAIYDPFGKRTEIYKDSLLGDSISQVDRGYTGHKHIAALDIIHMNGRIYDPTLGRFLQADPFIQAPRNSQNYNRYSYVLNNPLGYTDPSGYLFSGLKKRFRKSIRSVSKIFGKGLTYFAGQVASAWCGPFAAACSAAWTYDFNRAHGATSTGALRAAAVAGVSTYVNGPPKFNVQSAIMASDLVSPNAAKVMNFLYNGVDYQNFDLGSTASALAHEVKNYYVSKEVERFANKNGMTLMELNALLTLNSFAGNKIAGSRYNKDRNEISGFTSRTKGLLGVIWDVNDTILGYQGLLDASGHDYITGGNVGQQISGCHSLGTLTCNNLVARGYASSARLNSLPFGNVAVGKNALLTNLGQWDLVNGGWLGRIFNPFSNSTPCLDGGSSGAFCHGWDANYRPVQD